jgi:hypothetical protein
MTYYMSKGVNWILTTNDWRQSYIKTPIKIICYMFLWQSKDTIKNLYKRRWGRRHLLLLLMNMFYTKWLNHFSKDDIVYNTLLACSYCRLRWKLKANMNQSRFRFLILSIRIHGRDPSKILLLGWEPHILTKRKDMAHFINSLFLLKCHGLKQQVNLCTLIIGREPGFLATSF